MGSDHIIDINKVRDLLKQAGLDNVIDACKIPEPGQETEDAKNEARLSVVAAIEEAEQNRQRLSDASKYPGGHVLDYAVSVVKAAARPNATWKAKVRDFLMGEGAKVGRNLDTPDILYFVDPVDMGLPEGDDVYLPGPIPIKHPARFKVIMDSSGSMWDNKGSSRIGLFIALLIDVIEKSTELDPEIDVYMADTIVRGDPIRLTISDLERLKSNGLDVGGMGGTDFTVPLAQVCAQAKENQEEIGGILYLTDFGCTVPDFSVIPDIGDVPLLFAGVPQDFKHAEHLINGIEATGRAECASIEDNMILDFEAMEDRMTETRSAAAAPR